MVRAMSTPETTAFTRDLPRHPVGEPIALTDPRHPCHPNYVAPRVTRSILRFFSYAHLPAHLQAVSRPFADLAAHIDATIPHNAESTVALRKLLEAKDAAVRATLPEVSA